MALPIPTAEQVLSSTSPNATHVLGQFLPYGYMEIGLTIGALLVVFLIYVFWDGIKNLYANLRTAKFKYGDYSAKHRDSEATSQAISMHKKYLKLVSPSTRNKISRYD